MNEESSSKGIQLFAEISIDALKKIASDGRDLSSEALIKEMQSKKEIKAFFSDQVMPGDETHETVFHRTDQVYMKPKIQAETGLYSI